MPRAGGLAACYDQTASVDSPTPSSPCTLIDHDGSDSPRRALQWPRIGYRARDSQQVTATDFVQSDAGRDDHPSIGDCGDLCRRSGGGLRHGGICQSGVCDFAARALDDRVPTGMGGRLYASTGWCVDGRIWHPDGGLPDDRFAGAFADELLPGNDLVVELSNHRLVSGVFSDRTRVSSRRGEPVRGRTVAAANHGAAGAFELMGLLKPRRQPVLRAPRARFAPRVRSASLVRFAVMCNAALILCLWSPPLAAQFRLPRSLSTTRVVLPETDPRGTKARGSGFDASVEISNLFGVGYVGVKATLNSTMGKASTTRQLGIRLTPVDRHLPASRTIAAELPITFEQGQTQVSAERSFAKWTVGNSFRIEIIEDGVPLENYETEVGSSFPGYARQTPSDVLANEVILNMLVVGTQPISLRKPKSVPVFYRATPRSWRSATLQELPSDWRLLRDVDCIVIHYDSLIDPNRDGDGNGPVEASSKLEVIRDWVMMGGTLLVLDAPNADSLGEKLQLSLYDTKREEEAFRKAIDSRSTETEMHIADYQTWFDASVQQFAASQPAAAQGGSGSADGTQGSGGQIESMILGVGVPMDSGFRPSDQQITDTRKWLADSKQQLVAFQSKWRTSYLRLAGTGQVIGIKDQTIDSGPSFTVLDQVVGYRVSPILTRGVDPILGDIRSRRWLIPGVSEPPVYTFIGILTVFVLLVGPLAYRWTTRGHRSHLMFLIAPLLALITTALMFTYSIVSDGFGTTVRVRQLTWIDGASGDAVERTRSTLFSGISPRDGLRFAADAEVMAYPNGGQQTWQDLDSEVNEIRLNAVVDETSQQFDSSFLPSRSQTQFISHQTRRGLGGVSIEGLQPFDSGATDPVPSTVQVVSTLPFELRDLVVRSDDGRFWSAKKLPDGETATAEWIASTQDASKLLGKLYTRYRPIGAVAQSGRSRNDQKIGDLTLYINRTINLGNANMTDGVFEVWLNESLFIRGEIPPGTFVGISSPSSDVIAVGGAQQVGSIRYVMGTLK